MGYYLLLFICQIGFLRLFWIKTHFAYKLNYLQNFIVIFIYYSIFHGYEDSSFAWGVQKIISGKKSDWLFAKGRGFILSFFSIF